MKLKQIFEAKYAFTHPLVDKLGPYLHLHIEQVLGGYVDVPDEIDELIHHLAWEQFPDGDFEHMLVGAVLPSDALPPTKPRKRISPERRRIRR